ncbi:hypothetical protein BD779DRAFT_683478 [Infundibulicybe gibba]|nr:hypothetical protein BD779DRAFT_683478 [Infundibulicybe gibba]
MLLHYRRVANEQNYMFRLFSFQTALLIHYAFLANTCIIHPPQRADKQKEDGPLIDEKDILRLLALPPCYPPRPRASPPKAFPHLCPPDRRAEENDKSLGKVANLFGAIREHGLNVVRYYLAGWETDSGTTLVPRTARETRQGNPSLNLRSSVWLR